MNDIAIKISHVSKEYRLGMIGGATLRGELQSRFARLRGKEDPNLKIGAKAHEKNERFLALDDVSLEIKKGERVGIIGHNGAGKSTLLKLICRVTAPTKGEIYMNGRLTSMLEVGTGFHGELSGKENVYLNGAILGLSKAEIDKIYDKIVEFSEVGKFIDTPVKRYSSGMNVKLGFSVAAHLNSEIMIMDEVLAVGDMAFQKKCIERMRSAAEDEGRTILYVSHNMRTIRQLCTRCIVLDHGKIIFDGNPEQAIDIYMPQSNQLLYTDSVDLSVLPRHAHLPVDPEFRSIEFISPGGHEPPAGTDIKFRMTISSTTDSDRMFFECIIIYKEDYPVGMLCTEEGKLHLKSGDNVFEGVLPTGTLARGKYKLKLALCGYDELGIKVIYDAIETAARFFIPGDTPANGMRWTHTWWGHNRYPYLTLESKDKATATK